jgi:hypothetical protein
LCAAAGISCFNASGDPVICATQFVARHVGPCSPASVTYKLPFASSVFVGTDPGSSVLVSTNFVSSDAVVDCAVVSVPSQFGAYTSAPPDSSENVMGPLPPLACATTESPEKSSSVITLGVEKVTPVHGPVTPAASGANPGCEITVIWAEGNAAGPVGLIGVITGRYWFPQPTASAAMPPSVTARTATRPIG